MFKSNLLNAIKSYKDFPKEGILFQDISPIYENPKLFKELIENMSNSNILKNAECLIAIDARGFILASSISIISKKPFILARKPNKLPGKLSSKKYNLEYGSNELFIQKNALGNYEKFAIIDDLMATGGTAKCVGDIVKSSNKKVTGLSVVIELESLNGKSLLDFPMESQVIL